MNQPAQRLVARALRAGGPEVIEVGVEELPPLKQGEALVRVEATGLNDVGAGPSAAAPRAPLMLASGWGPLAPTRRCASLGPRLHVSPEAGRRAEFRSPSRRFCPRCKAARPPRHAETLIRSGNYTVRMPFPYPLGGEGSGVVVATGPGAPIAVGTRVCWAAVIGSCATFVTAPASMFVPIPEGLSFEDGACLAVASLTAGGLARVWPLQGRQAVVWGAAGAVGRMLVAILADRQVEVIGVATGKRVDAVRAAGAIYVIDRAVEDVGEAVRGYTGGRGVAAVFDPIGASTCETSLQMLAPRGCLVSYGELSGPPPAVKLRQLFAGSLFVTKYNGMQWAAFHEFPALISNGLALATKRRAIISDIAGRFALNQVVDAYRELESGSHGKVLVFPGQHPAA
ncbi:MAG: zinc-binding dehydrogenase [Terriglobales bacterium]